MYSAVNEHFCETAWVEILTRLYKYTFPLLTQNVKFAAQSSQT